MSTEVLNIYLVRIDLDIEGGSSASYAAFVNQIRSLANGANKSSADVFLKL